MVLKPGPRLLVSAFLVCGSVFFQRRRTTRGRNECPLLRAEFMAVGTYLRELQKYENKNEILRLHPYLLMLSPGYCTDCKQQNAWAAPAPGWREKRRTGDMQSNRNSGRGSRAAWWFSGLDGRPVPDLPVVSHVLRMQCEAWSVNYL